MDMLERARREIMGMGVSRRQAEILTSSSEIYRYFMACVVASARP